MKRYEWTSYDKADPPDLRPIRAAITRELKTQLDATRGANTAYPNVTVGGTVKAGWWVYDGDTAAKLPPCPDVPPSDAHVDQAIDAMCKALRGECEPEVVPPDFLVRLRRMVDDMALFIGVDERRSR